MKYQELFHQILTQPEHVYVDSAASTLTLDSVVAKMDKYYHEYRSNTHRGLYTSSAKATEEVEHTRQIIADYVGAHPNQIVFTSGTTAGINHLARALFELSPHMQVAITDIEHHSNHLPWLRCMQTNNQKLHIIPTNEGKINPNILEQTLKNQKIDVLAFPWVSNIFGTVQDLDEIFRITKDHQVKTVVDACQGIAHHNPHNLKDADAIVFSGHKMFGPTGVGAIRLSKELSETLPPFFLGGGMIEYVDYQKATYAQDPTKFEAGTLPIAEIIGWQKSFDWLKTLDLEKTNQEEIELASQVRDIIKKHLPLTQFLTSEKTNIITFHHPHITSLDIVSTLATDKIAAREGHHCVQPYHRTQGLKSTVRLSFAAYNSPRDIQHIEQAFLTISKLFL